MFWYYLKELAFVTKKYLNKKGYIWVTLIFYMLEEMHIQAFDTYNVNVCTIGN